MQQQRKRKKCLADEDVGEGEKPAAEVTEDGYF